MNQAMTTWDFGRCLRIQRKHPQSGVWEAIDPGVVFFILALERLGATTLYSCEGHSDLSGFYVVFQAEYALVTQLAAAGYLAVEVGSASGLFILRISQKVEEIEEKETLLRSAADAWVARFPKLAIMAVAANQAGPGATIAMHGDQPALALAA